MRPSSRSWRGRPLPRWTDWRRAAPSSSMSPRPQQDRPAARSTRRHPVQSGQGDHMPRGSKGLGITIVSKQQVDKYSGAVQYDRRPRLGRPDRRPGPRGPLHCRGHGRRKALLRVTLGISFVTLLFLAALATGRNFFLNEAASLSLRRDVAGAVWDTLLRYPQDRLPLDAARRPDRGSSWPGSSARPATPSGSAPT